MFLNNQQKDIIRNKIYRLGLGINPFINSNGIIDIDLIKENDLNRLKRRLEDSGLFKNIDSSATRYDYSNFDFSKGIPQPKRLYTLRCELADNALDESFKLKEQYLCEWNESQIQAFKNKFGEENFITFQNNQDRIKKNNFTTDINYYISNKVSVEDLQNMFNKIFEGLDVDNKPIPEPANTYETLINTPEEKLYFVTDYTDMIKISEGTGRGDIGGRNTGWCIGGRYQVPFGKVKVSQAKDLFYRYIYDNKLYNSGYFVIEDSNNHKYCLLIDSDNEIVSVIDNDDNDYADSNGYDFIMDTIEPDCPKSVSYLLDNKIINSWRTKVFEYTTDAEVPDRAYKVKIADNVREISPNAFSFCFDLQQIDWNEKTYKIGYGGFKKCMGLQRTNLPDSIAYIGDYAFAYCSGLEFIRIGKDITTIGPYAFYQDEYLFEVLFAVGKEEYLKVIPEGAFEECLSLSIIYLPDSVEEIGKKAFQRCGHLSNFNMPNNLITIGPEAFMECSNLQQIDLRNAVNLKTIGDRAFYGCGQASKIYLPDSIEYVGENAFKDCGSYGTRFYYAGNNKSVINKLLKYGNILDPDTAEIRYMVGQEISESYTNKDLNEDIEKHDILNPKLWNEDNTLKQEVEDKILLIVDEFKTWLKDDDIDIKIKDIVLVGSNCSYNYNKDSDLDIHLIVNVKECPNETYPLLYSAYRSLFDKKIDISFYGIPVELYIDEESNNVKSNGIYSVLNNKWIKEPVAEDIPEIDKDAFEKELKVWEDRYNNIINNNESELTEKVENDKLNDIESYIDDIYNLRKESLARDGEYGIGNLVFKEIRNKGYLDNLKDLKNKVIGKELSLESLKEDTEKVKTGKWVNRGKKGTHGTFKTKKAADAQRRAMFANGYKG